MSCNPKALEKRLVKTLSFPGLMCPSLGTSYYKMCCATFMRQVCVICLRTLITFLPPIFLAITCLTCDARPSTLFHVAAEWNWEAWERG